MTPLFINFSNHPANAWSDAQLKAAFQLGTVVDLPFPQVDPLATCEQVAQLAQEWTQRILTLGKPEELTVHVMGEMTLVYRMVTALRQNGVRCVASTTQRVTQMVDGKSVSEFHFVQFRDYD